MHHHEKGDHMAAPGEPYEIATYGTLVASMLAMGHAEAATLRRRKKAPTSKGNRRRETCNERSAHYAEQHDPR